MLVNVTLKVKDKDEHCNYITQQESEWKKSVTSTARIRRKEDDAKNVLIFKDWRNATTRTASL